MQAGIESVHPPVPWMGRRVVAEFRIPKRSPAPTPKIPKAAVRTGEGVPLHVVQAQLGHSNLAVTSRYVSHLQPQAVVDAMQARRWE